MAFLEPKDTKRTFNWDDIDVGNNHLDHSENFFARKHMEHEKLDEIELFNAKLAQVALDDDDFVKTDDFSKAEEDDKENTLTENNQPTSTTIKTEIISPELNESKTIINTDPIALEFHESTTLKNESIEKKATPPPIKKPVLLACWSTQKTLVSKTIKSNVVAPKLQLHTPKAYKYKEVYERKKQQLEQQMINVERKQREFHSHPAPNFSALHERQKKRVNVYEVTEPVTPQTLKRSKEAMQKKLELRKQILAKEADKCQKGNIHAHPAKVLQKEPFVPHKPSRPVVPEPFHLYSEKRLEERKLFDMQVQRAMEEKRRKEEEERKKAEEEQIRELKKLTIFKARPNPFK